MVGKRWTEIEARGAIRAWRKSGQPLATFARERGLHTQRFYWWLKKLGNEVEEEVTLLPVEVETTARGEPVLVMLRSGHMLKVGRDFDEEAFSRAVLALEKC